MIWLLISLCLHPDKLQAATGQIGKTPYICVWDTIGMQTVSILKDGHEHGVAAVSFDKDGNVRIYLLKSILKF